MDTLLRHNDRLVAKTPLGLECYFFVKMESSLIEESALIFETYSSLKQPLLKLVPPYKTINNADKELAELGIIMAGTLSFDD